jgi:hypothetical protein
MMFLRLPDEVVADWLEDTEYDSLDQLNSTNTRKE